MSFEDHYNLRSRLVQAVASDLIGPSTPDEEIPDPPLTHYLSGILYPQGEHGVGDQDESQGIDEGEDSEAFDPPVSLANTRYPSSMGLSFAIRGEYTGKISVSVSAGRYRSLEGESDAVDENIPETFRAAEPWKRDPLAVEDIPLVTSARTDRQQIADGLALFYRFRDVDANGAKPVTLVLLNTLRSPRGSLRDAYSFLQVKLSVRAADGSSQFVERRTEAPNLDDEELKSYELLYRHVRSFAVGHGCSVEWHLDEADPSRAKEIGTTYAPTAPVRVAESNPDIDTERLGMRFLASANADEVVDALSGLCSGYQNWIEVETDTAKGELDGRMLKTAEAHLATCQNAAERITAGIELLKNDSKAMLAFQLANEAMLQQRSRTEWLKLPDTIRPAAPDRSGKHVWRPFQLAFILLCLRGIAQPKSQDREVADLLWFPTGGGKTEAYLGLIAFTIFYRRLNYRDSDGVTALMRYTLRLLTIQQFERASLLVCCCESIRKSRSDLGTTPISIGLWVGGDATPNSRQPKPGQFGFDARTAIDRLRQDIEVEKGNPIQLHSCPWCGRELGPFDYVLYEGENPRMAVECKGEGCRFGDGLPVYLIDEDVFDYRPSLIIATVDKFASLAWREDRADLFNLEDRGRRRPAQRPPELIVQDELHLISGPLGTLTGLYETAVDALCGRDGSPPKVVASTATIRRAESQTRALFNRDVQQFPPAGIDARDTYFAVEAPRERRGDRLYMGLMAPATSHATLLVRAYAALLQNTASLPASEEVKDAYWTLVGYFNSLRVLGGARMQVQDDVADRISLLATRSHVTPRSTDAPPIELTSRESSAKIPSHLKQMAKAHPDPDAIDVILATNMISVGVDVDRLGLMVVMGQPQSSSEYIQATSRVGRRSPGLIVVLFNSNRSRDRSHYEGFLTYHSALYRQVESVSLTPFSARARDRALHAVLVGLARMLLPSFRPNSGAREIVTSRGDLEPVIDLILDRVREVAPDEFEGTREHLEEILDTWAGRAADETELSYSRPSDLSKSLLVSAERPTDEASTFFPTPWSLRDVDTSSSLYLV